jgi:hypothetical protein
VCVGGKGLPLTLDPKKWWGYGLLLNAGALLLLQLTCCCLVYTSQLCHAVASSNHSPMPLSTWPPLSNNPSLPPTPIPTRTHCTTSSV